MSAVTATDVQQGGVTIRPLQPTIGAETGGLDLRNPLSTADRDHTKAAILQPRYADLKAAILQPRYADL